MKGKSYYTFALSSFLFSLFSFLFQKYLSLAVGLIAERGRRMAVSKVLPKSGFCIVSKLCIPRARRI